MRRRGLLLAGVGAALPAAAAGVLPPMPDLPDGGRAGVLTVGGVPLFVCEFGSAGPPVLLLHGGMGSSDQWGYQVRALQGGHRVIVMDTRGHGRSRLVSGEVSYRAFARDAVAVLDYLGVASAAVGGWSDGAITGLQMAMDAPGRVSRLFAFGANVDPGGVIAGGSALPVFQAYGARCRAVYGQISPDAGRWPALLEGLRAMWRREPRFSPAMLAGIRVPVVVAQGERDEIIRRGHAEGIARAIPGARLVVVPGSHFALWQEPGRFNAALAGAVGV